MNIAFMGGKQAGCLGVLTVYAAGHRVTAIVGYDEVVERLAGALFLPSYSSIRDSGFQDSLAHSDVLLSVHGREIVPNKLLAVPPLGGVNVHPCLYRYKGADPIGRFLRDGISKASVGIHCMTDKVDEGEVLVEEFVEVEGKKTVDEVYNALYPFYTMALIKGLNILQGRLPLNS